MRQHGLGFATLALSLAGSMQASAQAASKPTSTPPSVASADSAPAIDKVKTPDSPAFDVLGLATTSIQRPTTPSAVATSLLSSLASGSNDVPLVPKQLSLEIAPYWLASHPTLTLSDYRAQVMTEDVRHDLLTVWLNIVQTFSMDVATSDSTFKTKAASPTDTSVFRVGYSLRFSPIRGELTSCVDALDTALTELSGEVAPIVAAYVAANPNASTDSIDKVTQAAVAKKRASADSVIKAHSDCMTVRRGLSVDFALAGISRFQQQVVEGGRFAGYAAWGTYAWTEQNLSLLGVTRIGKLGTAGQLLNQSFADLGVRTILKWSNYALSAETVRRTVSPHDTASGDSWRIASGFDAKVSSTVWLNLTFGRDFRAGTSHPLLALANLQWNFGSPAIQAPK